MVQGTRLLEANERDAPAPETSYPVPVQIILLVAECSGASVK